MNNLASAQVIKSIHPIEGADRIEIASILGWQVVVKKGEFSQGDLCTYIQIDTVVPQRAEFYFLEDRKYRIRTIKLRGQISQGLIIPLPPGKWKEGDDLTEIIGVVKYQKPDSNPRYRKPQRPKKWYGRLLWYLNPFQRLGGRKSFPTDLVSKTDEERIQNMPSVLETHRGKRFILSYKLNGSSITIIHQRTIWGPRYRICSRNFELLGRNNDWYRVFQATRFDLEVKKLVKYFKTNNIIVQGEAVGKFNGNYHRLPVEKIMLFNIQVDGRRLDQETFINICTRFSIPHCALYKRLILNHTMEEVLEVSNIPDILCPQIPAEGLVWRCPEDNLSFKVINNQFLLENEE